MIIPVFIPQAGCPHQCIFCNQETISGQKEQGVAAAQTQIEKYLSWSRSENSNELAFYGGTFTGLPRQLQRQYLELAQEYRKKGLIEKIRLSTRPDYINAQVLELLRSYGVTTVELGAQALDDVVLRQAGRGHTAAQVADAVQSLRCYGFVVGLQLMLGLPGETQVSREATKKKVLELKPDVVRIYPLLVIKQTPLASAYLSGKYKPLSIEEAVQASYAYYSAFIQVGIKVIRMGLQPDEELCSKGNILAGPFHPAFGEMVKSYGYRMRVQAEIDKLPEGQYMLTIVHSQRETSMVRGQRNANVKAWEASGKVRVVLKLGDSFSIEIQKGEDKNDY